MRSHFLLACCIVNNKGKCTLFHCVSSCVGLRTRDKVLHIKLVHFKKILNLSFCKEKIENAQNVLKHKNMERHFQNIFVRVSHNTCKKFAFLEILKFLLSIFPSQPDIYFIA